MANSPSQNFRSACQCLESSSRDVELLRHFSRQVPAVILRATPDWPKAYRWHRKCEQRPSKSKISDEMTPRRLYKPGNLRRHKNGDMLIHTARLVIFDGKQQGCVRLSNRRASTSLETIIAIHDLTSVEGIIERRSRSDAMWMSCPHSNRPGRNGEQVTQNHRVLHTHGPAQDINRCSLMPRQILW